LVSGRLARERQLLHSLRARSCEASWHHRHFSSDCQAGRSRAGPARRVMTAAHACDQTSGMGPSRRPSWKLWTASLTGRLRDST
jgi:hypothetical protein